MYAIRSYYATILITAVMAILFFLIKENMYWLWIAAVVIPTIIIFIKRPEEHVIEKDDDQEEPSNKIWLIPAVILLTVAGYFLDSVVSFSAQSSHAPKGVIGFLVLSTLTSWPEFKSCISLLQRVITSYSIHYTKLYDQPCHRNQRFSNLCVLRWGKLHH